MNLLALRIGRNHNYWVDSLNDFFDAARDPRAIYNTYGCRLAAGGGGAISYYANSLFNYEMGAGAPVPGSAFSSFFYYSNSYGLYFFLPLTRTLFYNAPFVGLLGNLFKSFYSSRISINQSFILPHSDIDYLINLFVFRFRLQKSFSNTLDLLQSGPDSALTQGTGQRLPTGREAQGWRSISGLKIVCNGRLNLRALSSTSAARDGIGVSRSKSFEWKWGHIPNNSSTSLDLPINFRFKPFFTMKGSNSLNLFISYKKPSATPRH